MSNILDLLKRKNFYLEKFLEESKKKRTSFKERHFENLRNFYEKREQILDNIQSIDKKISRICDDEDSGDLKLPQKNEIVQMLKKIRSNVSEIVEEDLQIISYIENEKSKIIMEMGQKKDKHKDPEQKTG